MTVNKQEEILRTKAYNILVKRYGYEYDDYDNQYEHSFWYTLSRNSCKYKPKFTFLRENKIIEVGSVSNFYKYIYRNLIIADCVMCQDIDFEFWLAFDEYTPFIIIDSYYLELKEELNSEILEYKYRNQEKGCVVS